MKKIISLSLIFLLLTLCLNVGVVFAFEDETINLYYNSKCYTYSLYNNIKSSTQFDLNFNINKYNRFGSKEERKNLLQKMLALNFDEEIAINYLFPNFNVKLNKIEKTINIKSKNAKLTINTNIEKVFNITPESVGVEVNENELYSNICNAILNNKKLNFKIPVTFHKPEIVSTYYSEYTNLRADFSTTFKESSTDRKHNIKNALTALNKIEILPNQVFSFNNCVGKRTEENGYRQAKIIVNNEFVEGIGGGVCQVSSTLYNAALLAGLDIVEANKHSKQVGYVKPGFDAMVNFGSSDLKIKNNLNTKVIIITNYNKNSARIRIFGEKLNGTTYKLVNEISNVTEPTEEILIDENQKYTNKVEFEDEYFYLKNPSKGMNIKSYRQTYYNNKLIKTELLRFDKYTVQNAIKVYGTKKRTN